MDLSCMFVTPVFTAVSVPVREDGVDLSCMFVKPVFTAVSVPVREDGGI